MQALLPFFQGWPPAVLGFVIIKLCKDGPASVVVPIDKLSILVTVIFSYVIFHEKLSLKAGTGLFFIVIGTLVMLIP